MKILQVNKYYYLKGGAESVYFNDASLLRQHGHQIIPFSMQSEKNFDSQYADYFIENWDFYGGGFNIWKKLKAAGHIIYSFETKKKARRLIAETKPEIVHLHNIYHQLSPSFLPLLKKEFHLPVVMTAHDYKLVCPNYSCLSNGKVCTKCFKGDYSQIIENRCHKGSWWSSALLAVEMTLHKKWQIYENNIDVIIAPSKFMKKTLRKGGIKNEIKVLPNFVNMEQFVWDGQPRLGEGLLYVGRLSEEKGLLTLLDALRKLPEKIPLKIVGTGEFRENLLQYISQNGLQKQVSLLGYKQGEELRELIRNCRLLVVPSISYENCPLSLLEAMALAKPVLASRIGGIPELLENDSNLVRGALFEAGDAVDLAKKIALYYGDEPLMVDWGRNARTYVEIYHSPVRYYQGLMKIYGLAREMVKEKGKD